jgi:hypothetical protein
MMSQQSLFMNIIGPIIGACIGAVTTCVCFVILAGRKERRSKALELLTKFTTDDHWTKARLVSQEYLVESGKYYADFKEHNFEQLNLALAAHSEQAHREARFYIRAVTSFFWLVDLARETGQIKRNEQLFALMYAWYWVHFIRERIKGCKDVRQFRHFEWMTTEAAIKGAEEDRYRMLANLNAKLAPAQTATLSASAATP